MLPALIGLNMSGAVSAGAYTAGVVDFLIDALDSWYAKRDEQRLLYGEDRSKWQVPAHNVQLVVMAGASAGGMTAAIAAAALCEKFTPQRDPNAPNAANRLYRSWVQDIDISHLLGTDDLEGGRQVQSLLDSTQLDRIAASSLAVHSPAAKREYVADSLRLILTLTNLRGVPYKIEEDPGGTESRTNYYSDQRQFELRWDDKPGDPVSTLLSPHSPTNWDELRETAKATGAFPLMLAPRVLARRAGAYNERKWRMQVDTVPCTPDGCNCAVFDKIKPDWTLADDADFTTLNVDGGVTNNSPFECARRVLANEPVTDEVRTFARSDQWQDRAKAADRSVITVAPLTNNASYDPAFTPSMDLLRVAGGVINAMLTQSRIQGEELQLSADSNIFSRFTIAPSVNDGGRPALAGSSLSAFGGFLSRAFRHRDYHLGRRNCQQFLREHYVLPVDNVVMDYRPNAAVLKEYASDYNDGQNSTRALPVIPLMEELRQPIPKIAGTITMEDLRAVVDLASDRIKLVADRLIESHNLGWWEEPAFNTAWLFLRSRAKEALLEFMEKDLRTNGLLKD